MKEDKTIEFKESITNSFLKTVSAYANFHDGDIYFGIKDNGEIKGIKEPNKMCLDIENKINETISPKPDYTLTIDNKTKVIKLHVFKGKFQPYLFKGKAYKRNHTSTTELDIIEFKHLILNTQNIYFEKLPYLENKLTFTALQEKFSNILQIKNITHDTLKTLNLILDDDKFNNAAGIVADKNSFYGIDIVRFGENLNEILDRETITNKSIFILFDKALEMYKKYYQYEVIETIERKQVSLVPEVAFREALVNALVHRDWSINSHIQISLYKDKINITSPGGLPNFLNKEEYLHSNISNLRNPIIGNIFFRLHYIEMFGTGISRIKNAYNDYNTSPTFSVFDNCISISLPTTTNNKNITLDEELIINALSFKKILSKSEIAKLTKLNESKVIRLLNSLLDKNYIKIYGSGRGTKYGI